MSFLSSLTNLFRSKHEQTQNHTVAEREEKEDLPSFHLSPTKESNDEHAIVFETMLRFVELTEKEKMEMIRFVNSSESAEDSIKEVFTKFNLQDRFHWSEYDYWLNKLGEERMCSLSYSARMYICGGSEGFIYEPITRETIRNHGYPLSRLKTAAEAVGIEPMFKRSWKSFEDFFWSLSESYQDILLEEASNMHRQHYLEWKMEHPGPDKIGKYWLYQAFYLTLLSRTQSFRCMQMGIPMLEREYPDATEEENRDWNNDKNCPWQEPYGKKNPFATEIQRTDIESIL